MRDKQVARVEDAIGSTLGEGEQIQLAVQAIITGVPAEQGRIAGAARELNQRVNARAAARSEGFAVLTSDRFLCLGKNKAMRPTSTVTVAISRQDIDRVDYKRGVMSTLTIWPVEGDGLALTFGLMLRGQADALNAALAAAPQTENA